jgi:hypothetical protein
VKREVKAKETPVSTSRADEFLSMIGELEQQTGRRLKEPGRSICWQAFLENPSTFEDLVYDAGARGNNPLALLVFMVRHDMRDAVERPAAANRAVPCPHCGIGGGFHVHDCPSATEAA